MATLSSASTDQQVWDSYDDNASYAEDNSTAKAAAFITACRILLRRRPATLTVDGETIAFEAGAIRQELREARRWQSLNSSTSGGGVRHLDFSRIRE